MGIFSLVLAALLSLSQAQLRIPLRQVSVWVEHRFATTEIALMIDNTAANAQDETVNMEYTLGMHESVAGLTAEIGSKIYEGKIMTREEAEIKCDEARKTNQTCVRIEAPKKYKMGGNEFSYIIDIPKGESAKVWLKYNSLIFMRNDELVHEIAADMKERFSRGKVEEDILQVYIAETHDLENVSIECQTGKNGPIEAIDMQPQTGAKKLMISYFEYAGQIRAPLFPSRGGLSKAICPRGRNQGSASYLLKYKLKPQNSNAVDDVNGVMMLQNKYFIHIVKPEKLSKHPAKRIVFVLDRSGSMSITVPKTSVPTPGVPTRMQLVVKSLKIILDALEPDDEFNIITFGIGDPEQFKPDLQRVNSQNIAAAKTFLDSQNAYGPTYLGPPTIAAAKMLDAATQNAASDKVNTMFILSDGDFFDEDGAEGIIDGVHNNCQYDTDIQINVVGLDNDILNDEKLQTITFNFEGIFTDITGDSLTSLETSLKHVYQTTSIPLFNDIRMNYTNAEENEVIFNGPVYNGQEFIMIGKLQEECTEPEFTTSFNGELVAESRNAEIYYDCENSGTQGWEFDTTELSTPADVGIGGAEQTLETAYEYFKLQHLIKKVKGFDPKQDQSKYDNLMNQIKEISTNYTFVTPYTSLVLTNEKKFIIDSLMTFGVRNAGNATQPEGPQHTVNEYFEISEYSDLCLSVKEKDSKIFEDWSRDGATPVSWATSKLDVEQFAQQNAPPKLGRIYFFMEGSIEYIDDSDARWGNGSPTEFDGLRFVQKNRTRASIPSVKKIAKRACEEMKKQNNKSKTGVLAIVR